MTAQRSIRTASALALALVATLVASLPANAEPTDLRSPDAREASATQAEQNRVAIRSHAPRATAAASPAATAPSQDLRSPDSRLVASGAADPLAQERYLSSYGESAPLVAPEAPVPSEDTPWLPIAAVVAAALTLVAASGSRLRRLRIRRRRAARATS